MRGTESPASASRRRAAQPVDVEATVAETIGQGKALDKLTAKQLRERILAAAEDGQLYGHVPPEARFGTKAELDRAIEKAG